MTIRLQCHWRLGLSVMKLALFWLWAKFFLVLALIVSLSYRLYGCTFANKLYYRNKKLIFFPLLSHKEQRIIIPAYCQLLQKNIQDDQYDSGDKTNNLDQLNRIHLAYTKPYCLFPKAMFNWIALNQDNSYEFCRIMTMRKK